MQSPEFNKGDLYFVSPDHHARVLHIPGLETSSAPKIPGWEDLYSTALQSHPRQTWWVSARGGGKLDFPAGLWSRRDVAWQYLRRCALFCTNHRRCYQGEPVLRLSKQHHSSSLPPHLPRTQLQSTQGAFLSSFT